MSSTEPVRPKHDLHKPHTFKTIKLHGKWYDRISCEVSGCPAFPYTLIPVKDIRPKEGS